MTDNIFLKSPDGYTRDLDIVGNATVLSADYLALQTGMPFEECLEFVQRQTSAEGSFPLEPVNMRVLKRKTNGDREKARVTIDEVIVYLQKTQAIASPNLVIYDKGSQNPSIIASYVDGKMSNRKIVKKAGFEAKQRGDMGTYLSCHYEEYGIKVFINSVSGAHASPHNPLYNKTGHSSLTSTTRTIVSYSNASSERFISGNRHYYNTDIVIENILSIVRNTDFAKLQALIAKYQLHLPTVEETEALIQRSMKFYVGFYPLEPQLKSLITNLSEEQRAAFMYTGDLYHLAKYNDGLVRQLIADYITTDTSVVVEFPEKVAKAAEEGVVALVGILCADILSGETPAKLQEENPAAYQIYANTIKHVEQVSLKYFDLFECLWLNNNAPGSIYAFPSSIRRNVVGSDTDSTMFTAQWWVQWYFGKLTFGPVADKVSNVLCFLNTQLIGHWMAFVSRQLGIEDKNLYRLQMKNEFAFLVYMRANVAKHYATLLGAREGNVFTKPEIDIKGVRLKDSKMPKEIMKGLEAEIENLMNGILAGNGISIYPMMQRMANMEHRIIQSLQKGEIKYLSTVNIGPKEAYKEPMSSNYAHYDMWINVFQKKFGNITPPPYRVVKLTTTLERPALVKKWVDSLDPILSEAMYTWCGVTGKDTFDMLLLPYELFEGGLPKEFLPIVDIRTVVSELMSGSYILLEMCGFFIKNKHNTQLLSDDIIERPEYGIIGETQQSAFPSAESPFFPK